MDPHFRVDNIGHVIGLCIACRTERLSVEVSHNVESAAREYGGGVLKGWTNHPTRTDLTKRE